MDEVEVRVKSYVPSTQSWLLGVMSSAWSYSSHVPPRVLHDCMPVALTKGAMNGVKNITSIMVEKKRAVGLAGACTEVTVNRR